MRFLGRHAAEAEKASMGWSIPGTDASKRGHSCPPIDGQHLPCDGQFAMVNSPRECRRGSGDAINKRLRPRTRAPPISTMMGA